ncbi:hypothetical protein [Flagellimonas sp. 2504JD4-2]
MLKKKNTFFGAALQALCTTRIINMKYAVFTLLVFLIVFGGIAQTQDKNYYPRAKVYLKDHKIINARDFIIRGTEASFLDSKAGTQQSTTLDAVDFIKIPKGNHVLIGTSFGAATGALSSLLIDLDTDALGRPQEKDAGFYLAMTAGGAALGALVGLLVPKWKSVYLNKNAVGLHIPLQFDISPEMGVATIKITMKI